MNKTKETYIAALYGVTPDQQEELRYTMKKVWNYIYYDVILDRVRDEKQQMIELCLDANRLETLGEIGDWFSEVDEQMLLAFDTYDVYPGEYWKSYAEKNNIDMWILR